jgi:hypothetical protein
MSGLSMGVIDVASEALMYEDTTFAALPTYRSILVAKSMLDERFWAIRQTQVFSKTLNSVPFSESESVAQITGGCVQSPQKVIPSKRRA